MLVAAIAVALIGPSSAQDINADNFHSLSEDGKNLVITRDKEGTYGEYKKKNFYKFYISSHDRN